MGNPILAQAVEYVREDTALDVVLHEEGGKYWVQLGPHVLGPTDHSQAWYALMAMAMARQVQPTLSTEKTRRRDDLAKVLAGQRKARDEENADA